jgi:hypothetical protein
LRTIFYLNNEKKKEENRLKVKDFHIPEDKTELDELWKKSGEMNINDLRPIYLKSGSKVTKKDKLAMSGIIIGLSYGPELLALACMSFSVTLEPDFK